jgi:hypothetical protein
MPVSQAAKKRASHAGAARVAGAGVAEAARATKRVIARSLLRAVAIDRQRVSKKRAHLVMLLPTIWISMMKTTMI